ncbi:hypothetical protein AcV7_006283 [Taiwanofungus camphoratus]|nr:hypothetical protein AcV7_006283 [Antrodia cinnamomea]
MHHASEPPAGASPALPSHQDRRKGTHTRTTAILVCKLHGSGDFRAHAVVDDEVRRQYTTIGESRPGTCLEYAVYNQPGHLDQPNTWKKTSPGLQLRPFRTVLCPMPRRRGSAELITSRGWYDRAPAFQHAVPSS